MLQTKRCLDYDLKSKTEIALWAVEGFCDDLPPKSEPVLLHSFERSGRISSGTPGLGIFTVPVRGHLTSTNYSLSLYSVTF